MLVLSRRVGEKILIADNITITIVDIKPGGKIRVGIEAPDDIRVDREEVRGAIDRENRAREIQEQKRREQEGGEQP